VGQFEIHGAYQNDKSTPSSLHGEKESKKKSSKEEEIAET